MPQPLSRLRSTVSDLTWGTKTLDDKPELAILVAAIFSEWAFIEMQLKNLMVIVLGTDAAAALAIYDSLDSPRQQMRALKAAAQAHLPSEKFDIFLAAISVVETAQRDRNKIAHWVWTSCPEFPDALILTDPSYISEYMFKFQSCLESVLKRSFSEFDAKALVRQNAEKILVYRVDDLRRSLSVLEEARVVIFRLGTFLEGVMHSVL